MSETVLNLLGIGGFIAAVAGTFMHAGGWCALAVGGGILFAFVAACLIARGRKS